MTKKPKYYVVWKGRKTGIFTSWEACLAQVNGFPDAEYRAFENEDAAIQAFQRKYSEYKGKYFPNLSQQRLLEFGRPILPSYTVDASCSGNPGRLEYRCVYTETGKELFRQGPYDYGTNNIGEFLAIIHALVLFKIKGITLPIYCDSKTAMRWVREKKCKTNQLREERNSDLFDLIEIAVTWLRTNEYPNEILKWETEAWGENPADFGRK
jgi:ribonuclease HI